MDELFEQIKLEIESLLLEVRALFADGLSFAEALTLFQSFCQVTVMIVEQVQASGVQKRELAIYCVRQLHEQVIAPYDLPVPDWLERRWVDPMIGQILEELAGGLFDLIVTDCNRRGWPQGRVELTKVGNPIQLILLLLPILLKLFALFGITKTA